MFSNNAYDSLSVSSNFPIKQLLGFRLMSTKTPDTNWVDCVRSKCHMQLSPKENIQSFFSFPKKFQEMMEIQNTWVITGLNGGMFADVTR